MRAYANNPFSLVALLPRFVCTFSFYFKKNSKWISMYFESEEVSQRSLSLLVHELLHLADDNDGSKLNIKTVAKGHTL